MSYPYNYFVTQHGYVYEVKFHEETQQYKFFYPGKDIVCQYIGNQKGNSVDLCVYKHSYSQAVYSTELILCALALLHGKSAATLVGILSLLINASTPLEDEKSVALPSFIEFHNEHPEVTKFGIQIPIIIGDSSQKPEVEAE